MNRFVLKTIACLSMLIDHIAYVFASHLPYPVYLLMRGVGRLAFVIFCFCLAEGFVHTSNRLRYALRLGLFALLSEIPFDLLCFSRPFDWASQNVYFSLLIGLLSLWGYDYLKKKSIPFSFLSPLLGALTAWLIHADYGAAGILLICVIYWLREHKLWQGVCVSALMVSYNNPIQLLGIGGWLLCMGYNGKHGPRLRYLFYLFYPLHMLALATMKYIF